MSFKAILVFYAQVLLFKSALSSCIVTCTRPVYFSLAYDDSSIPMAYDGLTNWGIEELTYDGLSTPLVYDGLAGWSDRELTSLATPMAFDGVTDWNVRELAYEGLAGGRNLASNGLAAPLAYDGIAWTGKRLAPAFDITPTSGGALPVSSGSAIAPVGISLKSDTAYEGILEVVGELPFVSTVGIEGVLPTEGAGAVNHACGNGDNSLVSEDVVFAPEFIGPAVAPAAVVPAAAVAPAPAYSPGPGYRAGWARRGVI